jgi:hypothetical protein
VKLLCLMLQLWARVNRSDENQHGRSQFFAVSGNCIPAELRISNTLMKKAA